MKRFVPTRIIDLELAEPLPDSLEASDCGAAWLVFWLDGVPLGQCELSASQFPIPRSQLESLAAEVTAPAVAHHLLAGPDVPIAMPLDSGGTPTTDLARVLRVEAPLAQLRARLADRGDVDASRALSLVICTQERPDALARCLRGVAALAVRPLEVIVVDNAPTTSATRDVVREFPGVAYVAEPHPGLSRARNTGVRHASGEIIAFTDDDVVPHPDWIERIAQPFADPRVMVATGLVLPAELETDAQRWFEKVFGGFGQGYRPLLYDARFVGAFRGRGVPVWRIGAGANMAVRRAAFERIGMFDERLGAGASGCSEDSELWYRVLAAGGVCRYEPRAVVHHYHRRDPEGVARQMRAYMRGHVAALLCQYERHGDGGNLFRLGVSLPSYYAGLLARAALGGVRLRRRTILGEIAGCIAGVAYYVGHRADAGSAVAPAPVERPSKSAPARAGAAPSASSGSTR